MCRSSFLSLLLWKMAIWWMGSPIWKINGPVGWWMEMIGVFYCLLVCMWWMEEIEDELDEKWIEKEKSQNSEMSALYVYPVNRPPARSTGHTKYRRNQVPVISSWNFTDSVPDRPDPVSIDWAHKNPAGITETWNSQTVRNPVYPVDITTMMSTGYTKHPEEPPSCLAPGPSGLGRHHDHDVDRGHCRMSTWEVNIQFTRSTSSVMMSTGNTVTSDRLWGPLTIQIGFHQVCHTQINGMAQPWLVGSTNWGFGIWIVNDSTLNYSPWCPQFQEHQIYYLWHLRLPLRIQLPDGAWTKSGPLRRIGPLSISIWFYDLEDFMHCSSLLSLL